jgi:hypothetical protein
MADDYDMEVAEYVDKGATLASGLVILTTLLLIAAIIAMRSASIELYDVGMFH